MRRDEVPRVSVAPMILRSKRIFVPTTTAKSSVSRSNERIDRRVAILLLPR